MTSSIAPPAFQPAYLPDTDAPSIVQKKAPEHSRPRRDTLGHDLAGPSNGILDDDVPELFQAKVTTAKHDFTREDYLRGYNTPSSIALPGYYSSMSDVALMRLAVDNQLSPEQIGALQRLAEQRVIKSVQDMISRFTKVISTHGVKVTPAPQSYYLSMVNQLAGGECAGLSHLLSLAVAEGKHQTFLSNLYYAVVNPDAPESEAFFRKIAEVQARVKIPEVAHDPATVKVAPYTEIAPQLLNSPTTKTLLISSQGHRLTAGVIVDPQKGRTYYFNDPNVGFTEVVSEKLFKDVLKKIFTDPALKHLVKPLSDFPGEPRYRISVFNRDFIPQISGATNDIKFTYDRPLSGLDTVKVLNASQLPTVEDSHLQAYSPEPTAMKDYDQVVQGLEKMHASKGMSQYHQAVMLLETIGLFINAHPGSVLVPAMQALKQHLTRLIIEAAAPVEYPYVFERMEKKRAELAEDKLGKLTHFQSEVIQGKTVDIKSDVGGDPGKAARVKDAVDEALAKLLQSDPAAAQAIGSKIKVIIANPGDQPETRLHFNNPPTLIIGDDFFVSPSANDATVADRVGHRTPAGAADAQARKQAAMIAGKLGMLSYYKADSQGFLEVADNKEPFRDGGDNVSARATRSPADFMEETFTARLYDGKLDSKTDAALNRLFAPAANASPPTTTQAPSQPAPPPSAETVTPTTTALKAIDEAEVKRLQVLDETHPPLRIGEVEVSRTELYKMGVHVNGKPIEHTLPVDAQGRISGDVEIDYDRLLAFLKSTSPEVGARVTGIVSGIAANRSPGAPPLATRGDGSLVPEQFQKSLRDTTQQAAAIGDLERSGKPLPADFFSSGETPGKPGGKTKVAGLGFLAFSTFQGLRSSIESFQRGDTTAGIISAGAVASDYAGTAVEVGLNKMAQSAIAKVTPTILSFQASTIGKMIGKVAGVAGTAIGVPFDIHNAVDSFNKAAGSTGKEAQDHYVNGAFAITNAVTSIGLSAAFLAGFSAAGPAGLAVAAVLMTGQAIYSAVRTVEDINEYTPLSGSKKFEIGLKSFLGFEPGFDVIKPYWEAKYAEGYDIQKREYHQAFLNGPGKDHFERVVFGSGDVVVTQVPGKVSLTGQHWWAPITFLLNLIQVNGQVPSVNIRDANDRINAPSDSWDGMSIKPVEGAEGSGKATLWDLGDGDDEVAGGFKKPNYFLLGGGKKLISGGEVDDTVIFSADARQTLQQAEEVWRTEKNGFSKKATELWGGEGRNTLVFSGNLSTPYTEGNDAKTATYSGHVINFKTGTVSVSTAASKTEGVSPIAYFHEFSNAATVENGESYIVGDDQSNLFTLNGKKDVVLTGKGSNVIVINGGATVVGEGGPNTYIVNKSNKAVTIKDPNDSVIKLDYSAAQVSGWSVSPSGDLTVNLKGDEPGNQRKLVIQNAFANDSTGDKARPKFMTNDGMLMTVSAPRQPGSATRVAQVSSVTFQAPAPQA
ncbi:hypothetical protein [Pseudomonas sp. MPB26]|uniref:hypothetical protein n=1 Tax=Pseudomonas sp. MPB26 TaxID=3388491 RepID=UPI00398527FF